MKVILRIKYKLFNSLLTEGYKRISVDENIDVSVNQFNLNSRVNKFNLFNYLVKVKWNYSYKILTVIIFLIVNFIKVIENIRLYNNTVGKKSSSKINNDNLNLINENNKFKIINRNSDVNIINTSKNDFKLINNSLSLNKKINNRNVNVTSMNYSDKKYKNAQKLNTYTAIHIGKVNQTIEYNLGDIPKDFFIENKEILTMKRGGGYWLWKPFFILKTLKERIKKGDYLIYTDSGTIYIDNVDKLISILIKDKIDIMGFYLPYIEKKWTKRDAFLIMNCDSPKYTDTPQILATFIIMKNTEFTVAFITEWLEFAKDRRIITDDPNVLEKKNYDGFIENRHDQTIFSLLFKKYNLKSYRDPSQEGKTKEDNNKPFPIVFYSSKVGNLGSFNKIFKSRRFKTYNDHLKEIGDNSLEVFKLKYKNGNIN